MPSCPLPLLMPHNQNEAKNHPYHRLPPGLVKAEPGIFTTTFYSIERGTIRTASERVAAVLNLGATVDEGANIIERFIRTGELVGEEGALLDACRREADATTESGNDVTKNRLNRCSLDILEMWEREYEIAEAEVTEFQKTNAFARWWDGKVEFTGDFDIFADLHLIDRQIFDNDAPESNAQDNSRNIRNVLLMAQNGFRMPADNPPYYDAGGCDSGEASLYGGLVCIPQFCNEFICVKIKAVPGRRGVVVPGEKKDASMQNIITDLYEMSKLMKDADQITPTQNTNASFWWAQGFNFDQFARANSS